jgi:hypothetical protein
MPSRRRSANKNIGNNLSDVQRRMRNLERRPARSKLGAKSVTTAAIGAEVITPEQVNFGTVVVGAPGDITDPKDGQLVINPNDGSVSVYNGDNQAFIDVGDPAAFDLSVTAFAAANTAVQTANGKSKVTYSLSAPGATANNAGDIWWQYNSSNIIIGQWTGLGGTSWQANTIGNAVVANLDAGKITTGFLDAARINAGTITATMIASTALDAKTITGSTIRTSAGPNSRVIFDTSGIRAINATGTTTVNIGSDGSASFNGSVTASSFTATGLVDGNDLANNAIVNRHIESLSATKINAGTINAAAITVINLNATNITTGTLSGRAITVGDSTTNFSVTTAGVMTATGANVSGTINTGNINAYSGVVSGFRLGTPSPGDISANSSVLPRMFFSNKVAIGYAVGSNVSFNDYSLAVGNGYSNESRSFVVDTGTAQFRACIDTGASQRTYALEVRNSIRAVNLYYTGSLGAPPSSLRFKDNVTYAPKRYYDRVLDVMPAFYVYKTDCEEIMPEIRGVHSFGLIAEDMEAAGLGYFVQRDMEGRPSGLLNIHEMHLLYIPIMKELKESLEQLTTRVSALEAK